MESLKLNDSWANSAERTVSINRSDVDADANVLPDSDAWLEHLSTNQQEQRVLFQQIGSGEGLDVTLAHLATIILDRWQARLCLIVFAELGSNNLQCCASPNGPSAFVDAISLASPDLTRKATPGQGGEDIVVHSLTEDNPKTPFNSAARALGYDCIWSRSVFADANGSYCTIHLCFDHPRHPTQLDNQIISLWSSHARLCVEINKQKNELIAANTSFASLAATIPGVVYQRKVMPDGDIRYTYISDAAKDLFGVEPAQILADPQALFDHYDKEYYAAF